MHVLWAFGANGSPAEESVIGSSVGDGFEFAGISPQLDYFDGSKSLQLVSIVDKSSAKLSNIGEHRLNGKNSG